MFPKALLILDDDDDDRDDMFPPDCASESYLERC